MLVRKDYIEESDRVRSAARCRSLGVRVFPLDTRLLKMFLERSLFSSFCSQSCPKPSAAAHVSRYGKSHLPYVRTCLVNKLGTKAVRDTRD